MQDSNVQQSIKSYPDTVSQNIVKTAKSNQEITKNLNELKSGIESKQAKEQEIKEKRSKENNVCFFNIPESDKSDHKDAFTDDIEKLHSILDNHLTLENQSNIQNWN